MQGISRGQEADKNTGWHAGSRTGKQVSNTAGTEAGQAHMQGISRGQAVDKNTGWHVGSWTGMHVVGTACRQSDRHADKQYSSTEAVT
jgi:hypothetical protein